MRTIALTSPLMTGADVRSAQRKLVAAGFLRRGGDDGVAGPETIRACRQAHWLLGFAGKLAEAPTYGDVLDRVLTAFVADGEQGLPKAYLARRKKRLSLSTIGERALDWLRPHVGDVEKPAGSNRVSWASDWYGIVGPWCAMGATRAYVEAGSTAFERGRRWSYVPDIVAAAIHARDGLVRTFAPKKGCGVAFDWPNQSPGVFDHFEIVDRPPTSVSAGASFSTIGCNTSFDDHGDQSNGGACAHKERTVIGGGRTIFVEVTR